MPISYTFQNEILWFSPIGNKIYSWPQLAKALYGATSDRRWKPGKTRLLTIFAGYKLLPEEQVPKVVEMIAQAKPAAIAIIPSNEKSCARAITYKRLLQQEGIPFEVFGKIEKAEEWFDTGYPDNLGCEGIENALSCKGAFYCEGALARWSEVREDLCE